MTPTTPATTPEPDPRQRLVDRICASSHFRRAHKLKAFLRHICEVTREGRAEEIKEHEVGTEVFGRKLGYNTGEDNIVRVQARMMRTKLQRYFTEEGAAEPLILRVPRGGYVPEFVERQGAATTPGPSTLGDVTPNNTLPATHAPPPLSWQSPGAILAIAAILLTGAGAMLWDRDSTAPAPDLSAAIAADAENAKLYSTLLGWPADRKTLVVLSNPKLLLYRRFHPPGPVDEPDFIPVPRNLGAKLESSLNNQVVDGSLHYLQRHQTAYTGIGEAASAYHVGILMERLGVSTELTQGRFLDWQHARSANLIILGSPHINDWTLENLSGGAFQFVPGGVAQISPDGLTVREYPQVCDRNGQTIEDFGMISLIDLGDSKALILAGHSSAGTQGVGEFFADEQRMRGVLDALASEREAVPAGWQALVRLEIHEDLPVRAELVRVSSLAASTH